MSGLLRSIIDRTSEPIEILIKWGIYTFKVLWRDKAECGSQGFDASTLRCRQSGETTARRVLELLN